jgi:antitoxin (DNA-binding transcriptional repressor) of toxin-antitoxin stability system
MRWQETDGMTKEIAIDANLHLADLVDRAEHGDTVAFTRDGVVVARIVPSIVKAGGSDDPAAAMRRIFEIGDGISLGGLRFKDLINEGRK